MRILTLACIAALAASAVASAPDSLVEQAEHLFFNRHLEPGNLDEAYRILAGLRADFPHDEQVLYLWSRIHVQKGDDATTNKRKIELYDRAKIISDTLVSVNELNPDGHMWRAVAQGRIGQSRGVMNSLFMVPTLKKGFTRVLEIDEAYSTAYDAFGVLYYTLPGIVGGDLTKAEKYLQAGVAIDPDYCVIRLDLAKVYIRQKRWVDARRELEEVLATESPTFPADAALDDKPEARKLLAEIEDK